MLNHRKAALLALFLISNCAMSQTGLYFDGTSDYVTMGAAPSLNCSNFTLEIWFKREGSSVASGTGTGGVRAYPLISKGRNESDASVVDANYFLGIDSALNVICADFEEGTGQATPGLNHPVYGVTNICRNVWYHAAVTYNGSIWKLYLNGNLETTLTVNRLPQSSSTQHAALGSALNSSGAASGFFNGKLDEARIWNYARTQTEISNNLGVEIVSAPGLIGRFGLNEGNGSIATNTGSAPVNGTIISSPDWIKGTTFQALSLAGNKAIYFQGLDAYLPLGNPSALGLNQFTIETWFLQKGIGVSTTSGAGGITAVPLVTKGRGEEDGDNRDMNYFLGVDAITHTIAADLEEGNGQPTPGLNHPIDGTTIIQNNIWYHAAVTYDGNTWKLYLNGILENENSPNVLPQSGSIQLAAIGSALNSSGTADGLFEGLIDEVRIWNTARTPSQIQQNINEQLTGSHPGLVARWSLNEGCGTLVHDSSGNASNGTITGIHWYWDIGAPLNIDMNVPPAQPVLVSPLINASGVPTNTSLSVNVYDGDSDSLTIAYYIRPCPPSAGDDFTIIPIPDTQYYTGEVNGGVVGMYKAQMNWIVNNRVAENIVFVEGLGDCVEHGDNSNNPIEWQRVDTCVKIIENPVTTSLTYGIPYGINVGNHDQSPNGTAGATTLFNTYFGEGRFNGKPYYGGHYGTNNNNNFSLFTVSGLDFIVINLEYNTSMSAAVISWMQNLLSTYSNRRAIIGSHYLINGSAVFGTQGLAIYNAAKAYPNVFLMLCGHLEEESKRVDAFNGDTITTIMSDYQTRVNGGNGWMRMMKFSPSTNTISVKTYSPWLNQWETDANSQYSFYYNMQSQAPFTLAGNQTNFTGSTSAIAVNGLNPNTCYEWYATVGDGSHTVTGPVWKFTTGP